MSKRSVQTMKYIGIALLVLVIGYLVLVLPLKPSLTRDWSPDQAVLAQSEFSGPMVTVKNIRNAEYSTKDEYTVRYYDKTFNLDTLESVWYGVEPFAGYGRGAAHTLVSFGFEGGDYLAISAEIRKEKEESFSTLRGLLRQYELVYIVADERDVLGLRANYRKDEVFLYPVRAEKEQMQALLVSMLTRANKLAHEPEFYNTLTNNCTTNIAEHVNALAPRQVSLVDYRILLPEFSDALAQEVGLIESSLPIDELRVKYRINERAAQYADDPLFSERIRE